MKKRYWLTALILLFGTLAHATPKQYCRTVTICNKSHYCHEKRICSATPYKQQEDGLTGFLNEITGTQQSALDKRIQKEKQVTRNLYGITFDEPTYILPFYYTSNPYQSVYDGNTPNNQSVMHEEFKFLLSLKFPIWPNMFHSNYSINVSYTQLSFWQVYANSQYFRETNYEPAIFISDHFLPNWLISSGLVHESNGRGGNLERSWNRVFFDLTFSGEHWMVSIKPWFLVFTADSSNLHNPDITHYLGYERVVVAYKFHRQEISVMLRNSVESGFERIGLETDYAFPIYHSLRGYIQYFYGYGQSLIEYNHKTQGAGIGITLSNWI